MLHVPCCEGHMHVSFQQLRLGSKHDMPVVHAKIDCSIHCTQTVFTRNHRFIDSAYEGNEQASKELGPSSSEFTDMVYSARTHDHWPGT